MLHLVKNLMLKKITLSFFIICLFINFSCKKENNNQNDSNPYQNCCGTPPLLASISTGRIYIPNIFTPNGNGINDRLTVFGNSKIKLINSFIIKDADGLIVFESKDKGILNSETSWDGYDIGGKLRKGLFNYTLTATSIDDITLSFTGSVCSYPCTKEDPLLEKIAKCRAPAQHDGKGGVDISINNFLTSECN